MDYSFLVSLGNGIVSFFWAHKPTQNSSKFNMHNGESLFRLSLNSTGYVSPHPKRPLFDYAGHLCSSSIGIGWQRKDDVRKAEWHNQQIKSVQIPLLRKRPFKCGNLIGSEANMITCLLSRRTRKRLLQCHRWQYGVRSISQYVGKDRFNHGGPP